MKPLILDPNVNYLEQLPRQDVGGAWRKSLSAFADETSALGSGLYALGAHALGAEESRDEALQNYSRKMEEAQSGWKRPDVGTVEDIKFNEPGGLSRAADYAAYQLPKGLAQLGTLLLGGGVGGAIAKASAGAGIRALAKAEVATIAGELAAKRAGETFIADAAKGMLTREAERAAGKVAIEKLAKRQLVGIGAGAAAGSYGMEAGQAYGQMATDPEIGPDKAAMPAALYGAAATGVELLPEVAAARWIGLGNLLKGPLRQLIKETPDLAVKAKELSKAAKAARLAGRVAGGAAVGAGAEGLEEGVQQLLQQSAERYAKGNPEWTNLMPQSQQEWSDFWNSAVAGGLVGGVAGGVLGPLKRGRGAAQQGPAVEAKQPPTAAQTEAPVPPATPPSAPVGTAVGDQTYIPKEDWVLPPNWRLTQQPPTGNVYENEVWPDDILADQQRGLPFATEQQALEVQKKLPAPAAHALVPVTDGFVLRPVEELIPENERDLAFPREPVPENEDDFWRRMGEEPEQSAERLNAAWGDTRTINEAPRTGGQAAANGVLESRAIDQARELWRGSEIRKEAVAAGQFPDTPEFRRWSADLPVRQAGEDGHAGVVRAWHSGSFDPEVDPIGQVGAEGWHFGTKAAAEDRQVGKPVDDMIRGATFEKDKETGRWYWDADGISSWDLDDTGFASKEGARADLERVAQEEGDAYWDREEAPIHEYFIRLQNPKRVEDAMGDWTKEVARAKAEGYDGLIYRNRVENKGKDSYVVFSPEQVKKIEGGEGKFAESANVLESRTAQPTAPVSRAEFIAQSDALLGRGVTQRAIDAGVLVVNERSPKGSAGGTFNPKTGVMTVNLDRVSKYDTPAGVLVHEGWHSGQYIELNKITKVLHEDLLTLAKMGSDAAKLAIARGTAAGLKAAKRLKIEIKHDLENKKLTSEERSKEILRVRDEIEKAIPGLLQNEDFAHYVQIAASSNEVLGRGFFRRLVDAIKAWWLKGDFAQALARAGIRPELTPAFAVELAKGATRAAIERAELVKRLAPQARKSEQEGVLESRIWRSGLVEAVERATQPRASAEQWLGWLRNQPGVKKEEMEDMGLEDWLKAQEGSVTKEALERFVEEGGVRVEEVVKGELMNQDWKATANDLTEEERIDNELPVGTPSRWWTVYDNEGNKKGGTWANSQEEAIAQFAPFENTKFDDYQAPGGQNYRELLVTIPEGEFTSSHWSEEGVLVHLRFNERTDAEGKRVLFVEEVQSDWHQEGRKKGYGVGEAQVVQKENGWVVVDPSGTPQNFGTFDTREQAEDWKKRFEVEQVGVPLAPMRTTSTWAMLGMKRAIKWAADHGFDQVAWTPGEVQAERYDLSQHIDTIAYVKHDDGTYSFDAIKDSSVLLSKQRISQADVADNLGKEIADRMAEGVGEQPIDYPAGWLELSGVDLKVGGEGMRAFYDRMLPNEVGKWAKKFGGKVSTTELGGGRKAWSLDLTPAMRAEADQGFLMYSMVGDLQQSVSNYWLGEDPTSDLGTWHRVRMYLQDKMLPAKMKEKTLGVAEAQSFYDAWGKVRSKTANAVRELYRDYVEPMTRIAAAQNWTPEVLDRVAYARTAQETNERGRQAAAKMWLKEFLGTMTDKAQKKALEAEIAAAKAATQVQTPTGVQVDKKARRIRYHAIALDWSRRDALRAQQLAQGLQPTHAATSIAPQVLERFTEFDKRPSGMSDAEAQAELAKWQGNVEMEKLFAFFDAMNRASLAYRLNHGLLTQDMHDRWFAAHEHYATLNREGFEEGSGGKSVGVGAPAKLRGYSIKPAVHVFTNTVATAERAISQAERNDALNVLAAMIRANPDPKFWHVAELEKSMRLDSDGFLEEGTTKQLGVGDVTFIKDGRRLMIQARPDNAQAMAIVQAIKNEDSIKAGPLIKAFAVATRTVAQLNTSLSPEFFFTNQIRDFLEGQVNMSDSEAAAVRGAIVKGIPHAWGALRSVFRGRTKGLLNEWEIDHKLQELNAREAEVRAKGLGPIALQRELEPLNVMRADLQARRQSAYTLADPAMAEWVQRYERAGVPSSWMSYYDNMASHASQIETLLKQEKPGLRKYGHAAVQFVEDYNSVAENAIRFATFKALVESGVEETRAATIAKELTINFDRKGAGGTAINSLYMFANASIQGTTRLMRAVIKSRPVQKIVLGIVVASALADFLNSGDDEWDKISDDVKRRNMIFLNPTGVGPKWVMLPAPWGYNFFWRLGQQLSMMKRQPRGWSPAGAAGDLVQTALGAFNPIGGGTVLQTLTPSLLRPLTMIAENKDWTGDRPLRPTQFPGDPKPYSELYWSSTSPFSKALAEHLNALFGGDKVTSSGLMDISPTSIDAWVGTLLGATGQTVSRFAQVPFDLTDPTREFDVWRQPVLRKFSAAPSSALDSATYHDRVSQIAMLEHRLKEYQDGPNKDLEKERALRAENRGLLALSSQAKDVEKQLKSLRQRVAVATAQGRDEQVRTLRDRMKLIMQQFNESFERRVPTS